MTGLIYKAVSPKRKAYVGQTFNLPRRKIEHLYKSKIKIKDNTKFYNAIRKYGFDNFKWEVIYKNIPENMLDIAEMCAIYVNDSYDNGYNCTFGGEGGLKSEETRKRMSESIKDSFKKGRIPWNKGMPRTREEKRKISETRIKNGLTKGEKHPMFGKERPDISLMNKLRVGFNNPRFGKKAWNSGKTFKKKVFRQYLAISTLTSDKYRLNGIEEIQNFCETNNISYTSFVKYRKSKNFKLFLLRGQ